MEQYPGITILFHIICLLATISMVAYGTLKFVADKSIAIVDKKAFHDTKQDIYPTFSLCLHIDTKLFRWYDNLEKSLYDEDILKMNYGIDSKDKIKDYVNFLMGNDDLSNETIGIEKMNRVNYDNVTLDLRKYVINIGFYSGDELLYKVFIYYT